RVSLRLSSPVVDLIMSAGKVEGVVAQCGDRAVRLRASQGVLIAAGGFARNEEMRQRFHQQPSCVQWTMANPGDTGEVIQAAMAHGAAVANMDMCVWNPVAILPDRRLGVIAGDLRKPHVMLVDADGQRFAN